MELIETKILEATNRRMLKLIVPNGGSEYRLASTNQTPISNIPSSIFFSSWLHKETTVVRYTNTQDPQYLMLDVLVTPASLGKLKSNFPDIRMFNKKP